MVKKEIVWAINLVIIRISKFYEYCLTCSKELLVCVVCLKCAFIKSIHVQTAKKHDATTKNRLKEGFLFIMLKNGQTYFKNLVVFSP